MEGMEVAVSSGANQAFTNVALTLCDEGDNAIILAPYYFSHQMGLTIAGANVSICPFDPATLSPNWLQFESMVKELIPKMVVVTSPNNPSGYVMKTDEVQRLVTVCKQTGTWLVFDQTYYEFLYEGATHCFPCAKRFDYDRIVHVFSFSKSFGMPGWRVGYLVYPDYLSDSMRKTQDSNPTHASIASQTLATYCMQSTYGTPATSSSSSFSSSTSDADSTSTSVSAYSVSDAHPPRPPRTDFVTSAVGSLEDVRAKLWRILEPLGTVRTQGAFYFLVPVPEELSEDEAVDILATQFKVLLMHGTPFGAPQYLRLCYGCVPPDAVLQAIDQLEHGFACISSLARSRRAAKE